MPPPWAAPPFRGEYARYDFSDRGSLTVSGTALTRARDLSGNGLDVTNVGTVPVGTLNGLGTATFPSGTVRLVNTAFSLAQPNTIFGTFKSGSAVAVVCDGATTRQIVFMVTSWYLNAGTNVNGGLSDTNAHTFAAVFNGAASSLRIDGTTVLAGDPGANSLVSLILGNDQTTTLPLGGDIGEWAVFPGVSNLADIQRYETYLKDKWLTVPSRVVVNNPLRPMRRRRRASGLLVPDHEGLVLPEAA